MLITAKMLAVGGLICGLAVSSSVWAQRANRSFDTENEAPVQESESDEADGGFFDSLFGDDEDAGTGRLIDGLSREERQFAPTAPGTLGGIDLARREADGADAVPIPLPEVQDFAEAVLHRLLDAADVSGLVPTVEVVPAEDVWGAAFPDGVVLISLGAVRNLKSEDEFAAILAHELSHVLLRHYSSDWFMESQERGLAVYGMLLDVKYEIEKLQGKADESDLWSKYKKQLIAESVVFGSEILLDAPFSREQEDEADRLGTDLLIKAGYSHTGFRLMLSSMIAQEEKHAAEKAANKQGLAKTRDNLDVTDSDGVFSFITDLLSDVGAGIKEEMREQFGNSHRPATERQTRAREYTKHNYPDLPRKRRLTEGWNTLVTHPNVVAALKGYRAAIEARASLGDLDLESAVDYLRQALEALPERQHGLPRAVAAEISATAGNLPLATEYYRQTLSGYLPTTGNYIGLAESLRLADKLEDAALALDLAAGDLANPPSLLPSKIALTVDEGEASSGQKVEAMGMVAECRIEGLESLTKLCQNAAEGKLAIFTQISKPDALQQIALLEAGTTSGRFVRVSTDSLNAREGPSTDFSTVASYKRGDELAVVAEDGKWLQVRDEGGQTAWVAGWLTKPVDQASPAKLTQPEMSTQAAAEPAQQSAPAGGEDDTTAKLQKLKSWHEQGLITDAEYDEKRQKLLETM